MIKYSIVIYSNPKPPPQNPGYSLSHPGVLKFWVGQSSIDKVGSQLKFTILCFTPLLLLSLLTSLASLALLPFSCFTSLLLFYSILFFIPLLLILYIPSLLTSHFSNGEHNMMLQDQIDSIISSLQKLSTSLNSLETDILNDINTLNSYPIYTLHCPGRPPNRVFLNYASAEQGAIEHAKQMAIEFKVNYQTSFTLDYKRKLYVLRAKGRDYQHSFSIFIQPLTEPAIKEHEAKIMRAMGLSNLKIPDVPQTELILSPDMFMKKHKMKITKEFIDDTESEVMYFIEINNIATDIEDDKPIDTIENLEYYLEILKDKALHLGKNID